MIRYAFLHQSVRNRYEYALYGLDGPERRASGAIEVIMAPPVECQRSLDQGRRRPARRLAEEEDEFQRLLKRAQKDGWSGRLAEHKADSAHR